MASIRNLKKDVNYVFGDIIDAVLHWEYATDNTESQKSSELIKEIISTYDGVMDKISDKKVENRAVHLKQVRKEFEQKAGEFIVKLNQL
ncbi:conserved hypothetical protein [Capnocytophaga canis]|uniref:hypothetical protein n=1 Tax=Capnocytophaga canis TaxID=1848903 RepID=UPI0005897542|nr:hypothetical protein [Capnocytophaga canis]CEN42547.1 conserved hypothetical protein [Capnocytophaga canis]